MNRQEQQLLQALRSFQKRIVLDATAFTSDSIRRIIAQDVKISYYISRISLSGNGVKLTLTVEYVHTDTPLSDIYIVVSQEEAQRILCQCIGNYRQRAVMFAPPGVDLGAAYDKFSVMHSAFYPNLTGTNIESAQPSLVPMSRYTFQFIYRIGKVKLAMMERETDAEIERLAKLLFLPTMSDAGKAFLAHNYLAYTVDYNLNENASNLEKSYQQSAYGALIKKKCVCQGYAEAFKRLMDQAGISCDVVCGQTKGSTTYHAWNIIKLNGGLDNYHIDVTWDATGGRVRYDYFGVKDADFAGKRTWNREYNATCNSERNLLAEARREIMRLKPQLLANGVDPRMFGF